MWRLTVAASDQRFAASAPMPMTRADIGGSPRLNHETSVRQIPPPACASPVAVAVVVISDRHRSDMFRLRFKLDRLGLDYLQSMDADGRARSLGEPDDAAFGDCHSKNVARQIAQYGFGAVAPGRAMDDPGLPPSRLGQDEIGPAFGQISSHLGPHEDCKRPG